MNILDDYKRIALSNFEVLDLVNGHANVILYPDLYKFESIDELLQPFGACFLLFETKPNFGHWCALIKYGDIVEFFDSYSSYPDDTLDFIPEDFKNESNQNYPYLTALLYHSPYKIEFNDKQYQSRKGNISTCGRHAACRIMFKHLSLKKYNKLINDVKKAINGDADDAVTALTLLVNDGKY